MAKKNDNKLSLKKETIRKLDQAELGSARGGAFIIRGYINSDISNFGQIPLLIRMGVEINANENLAPWFFFDLGPGINIGSAVSGAEFAWRIGFGTAFWGVMHKSKNKSDAAGGEEEVVVVEEVVVEETE